MFSTVPSLGENFTFCQIFVGQKNNCSKAIGMMTESSGCKTLEIFIVEVGAPFNIIFKYGN